jgi:hypothetical protein
MLGFGVFGFGVFGFRAALVMALLCAGLSTHVSAQTYPTKPIKLIVPFGAAGRFESQPGQCAAFVTDIANGPFYIYGREPRGLMSWTARGDKSDQTFCLSQASHFVSRNNDHMKDGKLSCPENPAGQFILVPNVPGGTPKFTFAEDNADRP